MTRLEGDDRILSAVRITSSLFAPAASAFVLVRCFLGESQTFHRNLHCRDELPLQVWRHDERCDAVNAERVGADHASSSRWKAGREHSERWCDGVSVTHVSQEQLRQSA